MDEDVLGGIDEAGRGPVFGPLVVAGVSGLDQEGFHALGVKDSKLLAPKRRRELEPQIRALADRVVTVVVTPDTIDDRFARQATLNTIEVDAFARIGRRLRVDELFVDAADVDPDRFGRDVRRRLGRRSPCRVVSEHGADVTHPIVSAASIVAKVRRDREVRKIARPLERQLGLPLGSGYSHDESTIKFMEAYRRAYGVFPSGTRRTWDTIRILEARLFTRRLEDFLSLAGQAAKA